MSATKPTPAEIKSAKQAGSPQPPADAGRRSFGIDRMVAGGRVLPVVQKDLWVRPFAALAEFSARGAGGPRVLVVPPLAGGFPFLLRDMVVGLLPQARVDVMDWRDARFVPVAAGRFGLDDNIGHVVSAIRGLGPELHVVGVCQGVVPALAATALVAAENPDAAPRSLVLLGGPVDPLASPTRLVQLLRANSLDWFRANVIRSVSPGWPGAGRDVYPRVFHTTSLSAYVMRHFTEGRELLWKFVADDGSDPAGHPFWHLCTTIMDLPAEYFLDTVRIVFQEVSLFRGGLTVDGKAINPLAIDRTRLATFEGEVDDISGPGQTHAAHRLCASLAPSMRSRHDVKGSGHFSLFYGRKWRREILPQMLAAFASADTDGRGRAGRRRGSD